jgi:hypothetical protein
MDVLKAAGLSGIALAVILSACSREPSPPPPFKLVAPSIDSLVHNPLLLATAGTIILVRVVEVTPWRSESLHGQTATLLVLKSWQGPFSAGDVLHTQGYPGFVLCNGHVDECGTYDFQPGEKGQEFIIMHVGLHNNPDGSGSNADDRWGTTFITAPPMWVWPAAKSQALIAALDQAVIDSVPPDKAGDAKAGYADPMLNTPSAATLQRAPR